MDAMPGIVIAWNAVGIRAPRRRLRVLGYTTFFLLTLSLLSCGGVSNAGNTPPPAGTQPTTYRIT
jgi:hypothetical protein